MPEIAIPDTAAAIDQAHIQRMAETAARGIDFAADRIAPEPDGFWSALRELGTELWLDTGDLDEIEALWTADFAAVTTNNSLLNKEIQKGIYDDYIGEAASLVADLDERTAILEVAFLLNARHGLRLASRFGCTVSVELHTDLADDVERSVFYGLRYHAICPEHFVVKIPFTPSGLIATRRLKAAGVPINHTLGFSARHNHLIASACAPDFCNVFLGRCNGYIKDNRLGDGENVGEKALLASQRSVRAVNGAHGSTVKQIAASMRDADQVAELAGTDVYTMPTKVASGARQELSGEWRNQSVSDPMVHIDDPEAHAEVLWEVDEGVHVLSDNLAIDLPDTAEAVVARAFELGARDVFPRWSAADRERIAADGKIPDHDHWKGRIAERELAIDTLLNAAGLAAFTQDQQALDERIVQHLK